MDVLDNQAVADAFPQDGAGGAIAQLGPIFDSNGGYYNVTGNPVYAQYAYGRYGEYYWSEPVPIPVGPAILEPGTVGVRFRNYTAGQIATVSGTLAEKGEPQVSITSGGIASAASGSGSLKYVETVTQTVAAATFDIPGLPTTLGGATIFDLLLRFRLRSDAAAVGTVNGFVRLNGDAGANYGYQMTRNAAAVAAGGTANGIYIGEVPAVLASAGAELECDLLLPNFASADLKSAMVASISRDSGIAVGNIWATNGGGVWANGAAINEVTVRLAAGNILAGSTCDVYGYVHQ